MKYSLRSLMTFSIRDVLWLTALVALALGWWLATRYEKTARNFVAFTYLTSTLVTLGVNVNMT